MKNPSKMTISIENNFSFYNEIFEMKFTLVTVQYGSASNFGKILLISNYTHKTTLQIFFLMWFLVLSVFLYVSNNTDRHIHFLIDEGWNQRYLLLIIIFASKRKKKKKHIAHITIKCNRTHKNQNDFTKSFCMMMIENILFISFSVTKMQSTSS